MIEDLDITDLVIPGKKGPFKLRILEFDEAFDELFSKADSKDQTPIMLRMAQLCLANGTGKPVYARGQIAKMKKDIRPAATLMALGMKAYKINKIDDLLSLSEMTETAAKN